METPRLVIDHLKISDAAFTLVLLNDEAFIANVGDKRVRTEAEAIQYLEQGPLSSYRDNGYGTYAVREKSTGQVVGMCGLVKRVDLPDIDIGFAFLPASRGKGYALEAAQRVLRHAVHELRLKRILAIIEAHNQASIALVKKLGFRYQRMYKMSPEEEPLCLYASNVL